MVKLDEYRISWIIKYKKDGIRNADIAAVQKISEGLGRSGHPTDKTTSLIH